MAKTVQSLMLKLALVVDPVVQSTGVLFTSATVGAADGEAFKAQELLDVYNHARLTLYTAAKEMYSPDELTVKFGSVVKNATLTFTTAGSDATAPKPADFIDLVRVEHATLGHEVVVLPNTYIPIVRKASNPHFVQTATTNRFLFIQGANFYGADLPAGAWPNAGTARLTYVGITDFVIADVTGGAVTETLPENEISYLLELAIAFAQGQGTVEVAGLAKTLLARKKGAE